MKIGYARGMVKMSHYEKRLAKAKTAGDEAVRRFEICEAKRAANREQWAIGRSRGA